MRKIVLFIVEGGSDPYYLGPLKKIIRQKGNKQLDFKVTRGDILTHNETTYDNVEEKIVDVIDEYLKENKFSDEDIHQVVHIVDLDGVYIPDSKVVQQNDLINPKNVYYRDKIVTISKRNITLRNKKKSMILNKLYMQNEIKYEKFSLKYRIYYFSTNIDDYFYGLQNCSNDEKRMYSDLTYDSYINNPEEYRDYIERNNVVTGDYNDTWEYIKQDVNSLSRCTNFDKFFKEIIDNIT